jgi:hypothetical protein
VAVLIDEYDAPILDIIDRPELAKDIREVMGQFYGILKRVEEIRGPTFITGVTKFTKTSIFSKLNNLSDLTLETEYADICGLTIDEFNAFLEDQSGEPEDGDLLENTNALKGFIANKFLSPKATNQTIRKKILSRYDGYTWDGETRLLNPWSVFNAFKWKRFGSFWFDSGPPTFLNKLVKKDWRLHEVFKSDSYLTALDNVIDIGDMSPIALLFQSGYLTISRVRKKLDPTRYYLRFPNTEVQASMTQSSLGLKVSYSDWPLFITRSKAILASLENLDPAGFQLAFSTMLGSTPPELHLKYEAYYQTILLHALGAAGQDYESESSSGDGRFDIHIRTKAGADFVVEMKYVKGTKTVIKADKKPEEVELSSDEKAENMKTAAKEAIAQIEKKKYDLKFKGGGNKIYKVALVVCHRSEVLIVFEQASNWRLVTDYNGALIVEST